MSITVNGQSRVPPGFRFHPTEEELLNYYLRKKVASEKIDLDVIHDIDLNKLEPWDILEECRIGTTPQSDWYFFSHKDKKYPTGTRTNRATAAGFWKATGRDKVICTSSRRIGMRKTLVFYKGRAPHGQKSDWIMHEYRLDEHSDSSSLSNALCTSIRDAAAQEDGWVVCRVFKKKNLHKANVSPSNYSPTTSAAKSQLLQNSSGDGAGALDQFLQYIGRSCKQEAEAMMNRINISSDDSYQTSRHVCPLGTSSFSGSTSMKLPPLRSPTLPSLTDVDFPTAESSCFGKSSYQPEGIQAVVNRACPPEPGLGDWAALDRLLASHLNCQSEDSKQLACSLDDDEFVFPTFQEYHSNGGRGSGDGDGDLWSLASSATDHISHVSHESM